MQRAGTGRASLRASPRHASAATPGLAREQRTARRLGRRWRDPPRQAGRGSAVNSRRPRTRHLRWPPRVRRPRLPASAMAKTKAGNWRDPAHVRAWANTIAGELAQSRRSAPSVPGVLKSCIWCATASLLRQRRDGACGVLGWGTPRHGSDAGRAVVDGGGPRAVPVVRTYVAGAGARAVGIRLATRFWCWAWRHARRFVVAFDRSQRHS